MIKEITSVHNELIKTLKSLKEKKYRDKEKMFLVEGYHLVEEAKKHHKLLKVLITKEEDYIDGIENILVSDAIIQNLSSTKSPQGIIGVISYFEDEDISGNKYLLLDDIQDPGNLGSIVRSAVGFNIDMIILSNNSVDIYNDKFIRGTQGAIFKMKFLKMELVEAIRVLKEKDTLIIGTDLSGENLLDIKTNGKYAIILGNEGSGVDKDLLKLTDLKVKIETSDEIESLNVAVAGSIIMFYLKNC